MSDCKGSVMSAESAGQSGVGGLPQVTFSQDDTSGRLGGSGKAKSIVCHLSLPYCSQLLLRFCEAIDSSKQQITFQTQTQSHFSVCVVKYKVITSRQCLERSKECYSWCLFSNHFTTCSYISKLSS